MGVRRVLACAIPEACEVTEDLELGLLARQRPI